MLFFNFYYTMNPTTSIATSVNRIIKKLMSNLDMLLLFEDSIVFI